MPITTISLFKDSINFLKNKFIISMVVIISLTLLTLLINQLSMPNPALLNEFMSRIDALLAANPNPSMDQIQNMITQFPPELLKRISSYIFNVFIISFVKSILMIAVIMAFIHSASQYGFSINSMGKLFLSLFPRILLTILILTPLIFMLVSISSILGIFILILVIAAIILVLSLLPAILTLEKHSIFSSIQLSIKKGIGHYKLLLPIVCVYIILSLLLFSATLNYPSELILIVSVLLKQVINFIFCIYCYRLYSLLKS